MSTNDKPVVQVRAIDRRAIVKGGLSLSLCIAFPGKRSLFADDTPLSPGSGGRSITEAALQKGDLIFSTTASTTTSWISAAISSAIRLATGNGPVSHAAIYSELGVVDVLISQGVTVRSVDASLADTSLAAAFRYPHITTAQQNAISDWAISKLGAGYDFAGVVNDVRFQFQGHVHQLVRLGVSANRFYCSRFVIDSYAAANVALTTAAPDFRSPNDLVPLAWFGELEYVGHLKS
jgi:hypothetical protein